MATASSGGSAFSAPILLTAGTNPNTTGRYGDYFAVAQDPANLNNVWVAAVEAVSQARLLKDLARGRYPSTTDQEGLPALGGPHLAKMQAVADLFARQHNRPQTLAADAVLDRLLEQMIGKSRHCNEHVGFESAEETKR